MLLETRLARRPKPRGLVPVRTLTQRLRIGDPLTFIGRSTSEASRSLMLH